MKLVFATNNKHKLEEVSAILGSGVELSTPASYGITEDIPETQATLEGNALQKARYVYERLLNGGARATGNGEFRAADYAAPIAAFADDTGLEVVALGGAPGVRSARYAADAMAAAMTGNSDDCCVAQSAVGVPTFDANNRLLLRNLAGAKDRSARFRTVIALILRGKDGTPEEHLFEGTVTGRIIDEYRGTGGFGYDPIFIPDGQEGLDDKTGNPPATFAEMSPEQKNKISHRARAVEKLNRFLKTI